MKVPLAEDQPIMPLWDDAGPCAAKVFGIKSRSTAYRYVEAGRFPVPTMHLGVKLVCRTVDIRRVLGLDEPAEAKVS